MWDSVLNWLYCMNGLLNIFERLEFCLYITCVWKEFVYRLISRDFFLTFTLFISSGNRGFVVSAKESIPKRGPNIENTTLIRCRTSCDCYVHVALR